MAIKTNLVLVAAMAMLFSGCGIIYTASYNKEVLGEDRQVARLFNSSELIQKGYIITVIGDTLKGYFQFVQSGNPIVAKPIPFVRFNTTNIKDRMKLDINYIKLFGVIEPKREDTVEYLSYKARVCPVLAKYNTIRMIAHGVATPGRDSDGNPSIDIADEWLLINSMEQGSVVVVEHYIPDNKRSAALLQFLDTTFNQNFTEAYFTNTKGVVDNQAMMNYIAYKASERMEKKKE